MGAVVHMVHQTGPVLAWTSNNHHPVSKGECLQASCNAKAKSVERHLHALMCSVSDHVTVTTETEQISA